MKRYTEERFWTNIDTIPDAVTGCREWRGYRQKLGYGYLSFHRVGQLAHRLSYQFTHKVKLHPKQHICHRCDNPPCCNPEHLFLGTASDNMQDMWDKKRHAAPIGEKNNHAILNAAQVVELRRMYAAKEMNQVQLAAYFGVTQVNVSAIVCRKTWTHI